MTKRSGSVSLMAVMIFSIIALLSLYLFSRLETQSLLARAMKDSAQSGYYAESLAYLAWNDLKEEKLASLITGGKQTLPRPQYGDITAQSAELQPIKEEGKYCAFSLLTRASYKGISSFAQLKGELVNPIFNVESGHLDFGAKGFKEIVSPWIASLEKDPDYMKAPSVDRCTTANGDYVTYDNRRFRVIRGDNEIASFSPDLPTRIFIRGELTLKTPTAMEGLAVIGDDAIIKGNLKVRGVCMIKPGARIEGRLSCDGLILGNQPESAVVAFNPKATERVLYPFPGFIKIHDLHMKKVYEE